MENLGVGFLVGGVVENVADVAAVDVGFLGFLGEFFGLFGCEGVLLHIVVGFKDNVFIIYRFWWWFQIRLW